MLKTALAALALLAAAPALAAEPPPPQAQSAAPAKALTVESPLRDLVQDPRTRPVIDKHLPGFAQRMMDEPDAAAMFAGVSLAEL